LGEHFFTWWVTQVKGAAQRQGEIREQSENKLARLRIMPGHRFIKYVLIRSFGIFKITVHKFRSTDGSFHTVRGLRHGWALARLGIFFL
jgi:hypothetical protein